MSTLSITLPDDLRSAADEAVASGRFATVSEYVATLIRKDRERLQEQLTESRLIHRLQAGPSADLTDAHFDHIRNRLDAEIAKRRAP